MIRLANSTLHTPAAVGLKRNVTTAKEVAVMSTATTQGPRTLLKSKGKQRREAGKGLVMENPMDGRREGGNGGWQAGRGCGGEERA